VPTPTHPELLPDPDADREAMERLQREIAERAVFADQFSFDPTAVGDEAAVERDDEVVVDDDDRQPLVAGVDQAFLDEAAVSAVVVSRGGEVVERTHAVTELSIPYVPGLLAFREGGPIVDALATLDSEPDLYLFDGSGRIHYRQAGLATHVGVLYDTPAVGVAKRLLCGDPREHTDERPAGWRTAIVADESVTAEPGTTLGYAVQTRQYDNSPVINPVYVSPGHRVSAGTSADLVERLCAGYKLPEPTRRADAYAEEVRDKLTDGETNYDEPT
jgi:deoxyribonuclease V